jgi:phosphoglycerol transferase
LVFGYRWFMVFFSTVSLETLVFHVFAATNGANMMPVIFFALDVVVNSLILSLLFVYTGRLCLVKSDSHIIFQIPFEKYGKYFTAGIQVALICGILFIVRQANIPAFIANILEKPALFYEENYIDPGSVKFSFPGRKRNLLVIFVESLETGFLNTGQGGAFEEDLLREIYTLAAENINFSNTDSVGGGTQLYGTGWTMSGIIAATAGIPALAGMNGNFGISTKTFLPNAVTLGDILYKAGYDCYWACGSDGNFAGRDIYFRNHGNSAVFDYYYYRDNNYFSEDYYAFWGFEDRKLYRYVKEQLSEIAAHEAPFFFTLLTVDTHFAEGYLDREAERNYDTQYKNVLFDMSRQLGDFISWIKEQDWYDNTTVVILGDHLFMGSTVFPSNIDNIDRRTINIFINSLLPENHIKNREFSHFDMFPAIITSIGIQYNGKGLGLGRALDKGEATLVELFEKEKLDGLLAKKSDRYKYFLGK